MGPVRGRLNAQPPMAVTAVTAMLLFATIHVAAADGPKGDDPKQVDRERLQGTWRMTHEIAGGKTTDPTRLSAERHFWVIRGDRLTQHFPAPPPPPPPGQEVDHGAGKRMVGESTFELDPKVTPATLTLIYPNGTRHTCIYRIDGDALTICCDASPRRPAPRTFDSPAGTVVKIFVFVRSTDRP
jgi:uncharacterized protein (TIGR03067 family)